MKINNQGSNKTELQLNDGTIIFFSYQTPVAAYIPEKGYVHTNKKYSVTTSGHITRWLDSKGLVRNDCETVEQTFLNNLVK
jgi:hypothetical protein